MKRKRIQSEGEREERRGGLASLGLDQSKEKRERSKPISKKYISWAAIHDGKREMVGLGFK